MLGTATRETQTTILGRVLAVLKDYKKVILGDREFCSVDLAKWLQEQEKTYFCLRLKRNCYLEVEQEVWLQLQALGLKPGLSLYFQGVKVTKTKGFSGANVVCKWKRKYRGWTADEAWFILTNLNSLDESLNAYQKAHRLRRGFLGVKTEQERFGIEEMFRDFKSGGYNLEGTKVSDKRLMTLILGSPVEVMI